LVSQVVQGQAAGGVGTPNTLGIPQMLFLNQITVNGQTSFVLVDSNNKPVQLPQGKIIGYTVRHCKQNKSMEF